jgi:hypothetical protein
MEGTPQPTADCCTLAQLRQYLSEFNMKCDEAIDHAFEHSERWDLVEALDVAGPPHMPKFTSRLVLRRIIGDGEPEVYHATYGSAPNKGQATTKAATHMYAFMLHKLPNLPRMQRSVLHSSGSYQPQSKETLKHTAPEYVPKPLAQVDADMKLIHEVKTAANAAQKAHLDVMFSYACCEPVRTLRDAKLEYAVIAPVLVELIRRSGEAAAADAHNALMHALNGNGLRANLHSAVDKAMDDARGFSPAARRSAVMRAVEAQFGGARKPRTGEAKKRNNAQRAKNGNELVRLPPVDEREADVVRAHFGERKRNRVGLSIQIGGVDLARQRSRNADMHASNGNGEVANIVAETTSGREVPEYTKALSTFKKDCMSDGLTKSANDEMLQLMDPCADLPRDEQDFPDGDLDWNLKSRWVSEIAITPPIGVSTNWSFMVCTDSFSGARGMQLPGFPSSILIHDPAWPQARAGNVMYSAPGNFPTGSYRGFGGEPVIFSRVADGTDHWRLGQEQRDIGTVPVPNQYSTQPFRLAGVGIEVINTTAPLYKQGMVTAFQYPARRVDSIEQYVTQWSAGQTIVGSSDLANLGASTTPISTVTTAMAIGVARPPYNQTEAANAKGSRSWSAANGYYAPGVFESIPEIGPAVPFCPYWYDTTIPEGGPNVAPIIVGLMPGRAVFNAGTTVQNRLVSTTESTGSTALAATSTPFTWDGLTPYCRYLPLSRKGCIFTGLSPQTTLTLRVVYYIVRVPQVNQIDLYALTKKPSAFDPYFWAAYKKATQEMPVGVPFTENPLGEWFNTVTKMLAKAAPIVGQLIPGSGPLALAAGQLAKAANHWNRGKSKDDKDKEPKSYKGRTYGY